MAKFGVCRSLSSATTALWQQDVGGKFQLLKKLNIPTPKTTEDFKNMPIAFRTKDANGNGKQDEVL